MTTDIESAFILSKELIENIDKVSRVKSKMKGLKDEIKAYDERNEIIMGELRVHTEEVELDTESSY